MIIHEPELDEKEGEAIRWARVEFERPAPDVPERLWFKAPGASKNHLSEGSEGFAAALLLTSMYWGEDLQIRGQVSARFAYGFQEYMQAFHILQPKVFQEIGIHFERIVEPARPTRRAGSLAAFSGGVDSQHTLMTNLREHAAGDAHRISHGLFLQGIDYGIEEGEAFDSAFERYRRTLQGLGVELIPLRTNAGLFSRYRISQAWNYGGIVIGAGLCLGKGFERFYISSGQPYSNLIPNGSLPYVDHLLSSAEMEIVHCGAAHTRFEKLQAISGWTPAQENLRVCTRSPKQMEGRNCCRCSKCYATMLRMALLGVSGEFRGFCGPFQRRMFLPWLVPAADDFTLRDMLRLAVQKGRWDYVPGLLALRASLALREGAVGAVRGLVGRERLVGLKRRYYGRREAARGG